MKNDPIAKLVKDSRPKISDDFAEVVMQKVESKIEKRMRLKIYLLLFFVIAYFIFTFYVLYSSGYKIALFDYELFLPKTLSILTLMLMSYFVIWHLIAILNLSLRKT